MRIESVDHSSPAHAEAIAAIWSAACGPDLAISPQAVAYNLLPCAGARHGGRIVFDGDSPTGFALVSTLKEDPQASSPEFGWIDAIAVAPASQRNGIGSALLEWAEGWLAEQGCTYWMIGGSMRTWAPGAPATVGSERFFLERGYVSPPDYARVWDVARDLRDYETPATAMRGQGLEVRPASESDAPALLDFLTQEFPGRWRYEFEEFMRNGERISDYVLLRSGQGIEGFCLLTFEDSVRPLNRFFPWSLPRPWCQLGTIGVASARRGQGLGAVLMDGGLCRLRARGARGCVIDWTTIVDFYGKFGFTPYREYVILASLRKG